MKKIKKSGRTEANESKNNVTDPTVLGNNGQATGNACLPENGQELTLSKKLELRHRVNKRITNKVVKAALRKAEKLLAKGEFEAAANELKRTVEATGDIRARLPLAQMQYYELGGEQYDSNMFLYNHQLAAAEGYIPSMHMLSELYEGGIIADVYHEGQIMSNRAAILDPMGKLKHYLHDILAPNVMDRDEQVAKVIKAIHEPANHFYNHEEAGKYAALLDISTSPNRRFVEVMGGRQCEELLNESAVYLHAWRYENVERVLQQVKKFDVVAANSYLAKLYIIWGNAKKAYECVNIAVAFGSVPLMYTLSAMYRYGCGVRKSNTLADAWYWKAVESDIDNLGLKNAILF